MIISHKYRFIFIKTSKTAGTSMEIALSKFCGDQDIITPISLRDERTRQHLGYRGPQNYRFEIDRSTIQEDANRRLRFSPHVGARQIRRRIGVDIWDNYFKFCLERKPWDRVISYYYWRCQSEPRPTLSDFIESDGLGRLKRLGIGLYTLNREVAVDRVCLYENMPIELETIRLQLGLPEPLNLPRAKSTTRKDRRSYREILSEADKVRIAGQFSDEIELFNYVY